MTREFFEEIMERNVSNYSLPSRIFCGLEIIRKYIPEADIEAADHDIVYAVSVDKLVDAAITEKDVMKLAELCWHIEEDSLAHFA